MSEIQLPAEKICSTLEHNFVWSSCAEAPALLLQRTSLEKMSGAEDRLIEAQSQGPDSGKGDLQYELQGRCFVPWQQLKGHNGHTLAMI
jgi:hypothetical protein